MTQIYCSAPWKSLAIREDGKVRTCCPGQNIIADLNSDPIEQIESSAVLQKIQQIMIDGGVDEKNCNLCLHQEKDHGVAPHRQHFLKYYPLDQLSDSFPSTIDLRWNNSCNLACVYCNPQFSSTWSIRLEGSAQIKKVRPYQDELLEWLLSKSHHLKEVTLVGGEPMLQKQNYELIKHLPKDCKITIITNLSYDITSLPCISDLLDRPKENVMWNISAENIGAKFEYVRSGSNWQTIVKNIEWLNQYFPECQTVLMTYFLLSAMDLPETIKEFMRLGVKKFLLQPVIGNDGADIFRLPVPFLQMAEQRLKESIDLHKSLIHPEDREFYRIDCADDILYKLQQSTVENILSREQVISQIEFYNRWNHKKFSDLWPELSSMIQEHCR